MGRLSVIRMSLFLSAWLAAVSVMAHHAATGRYERDTFGEIQGEITDIFWRNPHVRFIVTRTGDDGQVEDWEVEFGSVNTIERLGVIKPRLLS